MPSRYETFWTHHTYVVVGHSAKSPFPQLTYQGLKEQGKQVFPVDPSAELVDGDRAYDSIEALPTAVEVAVLEVPREETQAWVARVADAGIQQVWIHMNRDSPEALALAKARGLQVHTGTCAVMYLKGGYHKIHKWIHKLVGKY